MQERLRSDAGPGLSLTDTEPLSVDAPKLRSERLARLRDMMREKEYAAVLLFDPNNQRYATGSRNMFGYFLRNSTRYFFVPDRRSDHPLRVPAERARVDLPGDRAGGAQFEDRLVLGGRARCRRRRNRSPRKLPHWCANTAVARQRSVSTAAVIFKPSRSRAKDWTSPTVSRKFFTCAGSRRTKRSPACGSAWRPRSSPSPRCAKR